jgi:hypothetical protein
MKARAHYLLREEDDDQVAWELAAGAGAFLPSSISGVAAWLRLQNATVTGSGYSSVPDVLSSNPAVQGTDARRPVNATAANGLPIATFTDDFLDWPLVNGSNNQSPAWGLALWVKCTADGTPRRIWSAMTAQASANRAELNQDTNGARGLHCDIYINNTSTRRGATQTTTTAGGWSFVTVEYDGAQATEAARCIVTIDGSVKTLTFSDANGTPGAMPATLVQPTGSVYIGARDTVPNQPFVGSIGPNIYVLNRQLTAAERTALMGFEQPT